MAGSKRGGAREGAGRPAKGRQSKCVTLTMSLEAAEMLKAMADEKGLSISNFIVEHFNLPKYPDVQKEIKKLENIPDEVPSPYQMNFPAYDLETPDLFMAAEEGKDYQ